MNAFFSLLRGFFEKDAITTICVLFLIAAAVVCYLLYKKHLKKDKSPDFLEHEGYYKITLTPTGYAITGKNNLFRTLSDFYYLRKDPFSIEVSIDEIKADDGKSYRALANVTVILPENRIDYVCRRYFNGNNSSAAHDVNEILSRKLNNGFSDADAILSYQKKDSYNPFLSYANSKGADSRRASSKTNCDADIDMELIIAFTATLKQLVKENAGNLSKEEIKKSFLGKAMLCAMDTGHAVTGITLFNVIENND